ncbi:MAG: FAD-dependent oxidoreductase [Oscillospiraceae bacterium]|nr:FAD-dependent oxidoreductase [Oscillospiraceae bacterium]
MSIDREGKTVAVLGPQGRYEESYDKLILATGCRPVIPNIKGAQLANVCTVFTIDDVDKIMAALECGARSAVVIGGGFIGLEAAEALLKRGLNTTLVELAPTLMSSFDAEFSRPMERHLAAAGLKIRLGASVSELRGDERGTAAVLADGTVLPADIVIMAAGIRPRTELAEKAGLPLGDTGAIRVNDAMQQLGYDVYNLTGGYNAYIMDV